ncbi:response regulator transcription factor [Ramlibacter monticola]|uniref:Response regulator transcription factor n=1 Tax=Ramlibacter monticola TaxID=1926872 RepID=A0A936Z3E4_9BURK|nr:response regulator transcription factor [Ramlibacter monticola]
MRVAAVDDDPAQLSLLASTMRAMGHGCHTFTSGKALLRAMRTETFDLLLVDWQMPDMSGPDLVMWIREKVSTTLPVMFVTVRDEECDIVRGLNCGADDYMCKPVRVGELMARTRALLRRGRSGQQEQSDVRRFGDVEFDTRTRAVTMKGSPIDLRGREYDLALFLFKNVGQPLSRRHLTEALWGFGVELNSRTLDTLVSMVRGKMKLRPENGFKLGAVYNVGYRLDVLGDGSAGAATK